MDKSIITTFLDKRPATLGTFLYGSAVFKQESYSESDKPQIDMVFIVDDMKEWHRQNIRMNPHDYPLLGRLHVNLSSVKALKGGNKITYFSHIKENGYTFKFGVTELKDFIDGLSTWSPFFVAGRFQKPILPINTTPAIDEAILYNRESALLIASFFCDEITTVKELFIHLCWISYIGAVRMKIAENPHKVENIVNGSFDELVSIYKKDRDYISFDGDIAYIDREKQFAHIKDLPDSIFKYLLANGVDFRDIDSIRNGIVDYLSECNRREEIAQIIKGLQTNGVLRNISYGVAKLSKKLKSR